MRSARFALLCTLVACGSSGGQGDGPDADPSAPDADPEAADAAPAPGRDHVLIVASRSDGPIAGAHVWVHDAAGAVSAEGVTGADGHALVAIAGTASVTVEARTRDTASVVTFEAVHAGMTLPMLDEIARPLESITARFDVAAVEGGTSYIVDAGCAYSSTATPGARSLLLDPGCFVAGKLTAVGLASGGGAYRWSVLDGVDATTRAAPVAWSPGAQAATVEVLAGATGPLDLKAMVALRDRTYLRAALALPAAGPVSVPAGTVPCIQADQQGSFLRSYAPTGALSIDPKAFLPSVTSAAARPVAGNAPGEMTLEWALTAGDAPAYGTASVEVTTSDVTRRWRVVFPVTAESPHHFGLPTPIAAGYPGFPDKLLRLTLYAIAGVDYGQFAQGWNAYGASGYAGGAYTVRSTRFPP